MRRAKTLLGAAALVASAAVTLAAEPAWAGDGPQAPPQGPRPSPVVVEQVQTGPLFSVDVKYARVNDEDEVLLGGSGGMLFDGKLLIGAAGYWMVTGDELNGMTYGGALVEWYALRGSRVALSLGGLVGGGFARVTSGWDDWYMPMPADQVRFSHGGGRPGYYPPAQYYWAYDQGFFVAEPQVNVVWQVAPGVAIVGGAGYRIVGAANGAEDQIKGITGSFSIRFGGGR